MISRPHDGRAPQNKGRLIGQKPLTYVNGSLKFSKTDKHGLEAT
jgi:hypothetical protein